MPDMTTAHTPINPPLFAKDVMTLLGIKHPNTLRLHIRSGRIPPPDVQLTQKTRYWWRPTLEKAGLIPGHGKSASNTTETT